MDDNINNLLDQGLKIKKVSDDDDTINIKFDTENIQSTEPLYDFLDAMDMLKKLSEYNTIVVATAKSRHETSQIKTEVFTFTEEEQSIVTVLERLWKEAFAHASSTAKEVIK